MPPAEPAVVSPPLLEATGLRRSFGALTALRGVDLTLRSGEVLTVLGPNGAGKTTLLRLLAGLMRPTAGEVRLNGDRLSVRDAKTRRGVGLLSHQSHLYDDLTVRENLLFAARLYQLPDPAATTAAAIAEVELEAKADEPIRSLSRGMQQRAAIARALIHRPELLLLDEPFTGLDTPSAERFRALLAAQAAQGKGLVIVTHHASETWDFSTRVAVLVRGRWVLEEPCGGGLDGFLDRYREVAAHG
ncbi:MAG: heme ABC exporter ATP-binding protein CcmA [Gemmatimonadota bacterium]